MWTTFAVLGKRSKLMFGGTRKLWLYLPSTSIQGFPNSTQLNADAVRIGHLCLPGTKLLSSVLITRNFLHWTQLLTWLPLPVSDGTQTKKHCIADTLYVVHQGKSLFFWLVVNIGYATHNGLNMQKKKWNSAQKIVWICRLKMYYNSSSTKIWRNFVRP